MKAASEAQSSSPARGIVPPPNGDVSGARPRVLLAEDDVDTRKMLKHVLLFAGYDVIEIENGLELMCYLSSSAVDEVLPPDVIITDIRMPYFSGLDMLRSVQRCTVAAPVILISAFCDDKTRELAQKGGAVALLQKPLAADQLLAILAELRPKMTGDAS
ncbi:MAG: response regulator [Polyangiaceae bacterium]|nr:response regulator [Polyangiaceae bacterium]